MFDDGLIGSGIMLLLVWLPAAVACVIIEWRAK